MNTGNPIKDFGSRITYMRNKKGMSQAELARLLGKSQSLIAAYENGRVKSLPDDEMLLAFANALGTKPESILGANEFILDRFDPAVSAWLASEESTEFVKDAFIRWATSKARA